MVCHEQQRRQVFDAASFDAGRVGARLRLRRGIRRVRHALERFPAKGRTSWHGARRLHRRTDHDRRRMELPLHGQPPAGARRHIRVRVGGVWPRPRLPLRRIPRICLLGDRLAGRDGAGGRTSGSATRSRRATSTLETSCFPLPPSPSPPRSAAAAACRASSSWCWRSSWPRGSSYASRRRRSATMGGWSRCARFSPPIAVPAFSRP